MISNSFSKSLGIFVLVSMTLLLCNAIQAQDTQNETELDRSVRNFLENNKGQWRDMNVPASDGQILFDIIIENKYSKGLEIGTSTGHSTIWIAWAMSKTGGKLITLENNKSRHNKAVANFKEAGLLDFIDARLVDAHDEVKKLDGPFDFVFSDADKDWYTNYFKTISPKLISGGCFTAHNVRPGRHGRGMRGTREYLNYVQGLETYKTTVDNSGGGLAISYKN